MDSIQWAAAHTYIETEEQTHWPYHHSDTLFVLNANCASSVSNELVLVTSDMNLFLFFPPSPSK